MKGLLVAVIVLAVALGAVVLAFAASALAVGRKLRQLRASRDSQFLIRGDSVRAVRCITKSLGSDGLSTHSEPQLRMCIATAKPRTILLSYAVSPPQRLYLIHCTSNKLLVVMRHPHLRRSQTALDGASSSRSLSCSAVP